MKAKKMTITVKIPKPRDWIARDLHLNGLYRQRIVKSKKVYDRKKLKKPDTNGDE